MKKETLNLRIDADLKLRAVELAEAEGRSLANWVKHLIRSSVARAEDPGQQSTAANPESTDEAPGE